MQHILLSKSSAVMKGVNALKAEVLKAKYRYSMKTIKVVLETNIRDE